jgi:hypothetical protein
MSPKSRLYTGLFVCPRCGAEYECVRLRREDLFCEHCLEYLKDAGEVEVWIRRSPGARMVERREPEDTP